MARHISSSAVHFDLDEWRGEQNNPKARSAQAHLHARPMLTRARTHIPVPGSA